MEIISQYLEFLLAVFPFLCSDIYSLSPFVSLLLLYRSLSFSFYTHIYIYICLSTLYIWFYLYLHRYIYCLSFGQNICPSIYLFISSLSIYIYKFIYIYIDNLDKMSLEFTKPRHINMKHIYVKVKEINRQEICCRYDVPQHGPNDGKYQL